MNKSKSEVMPGFRCSHMAGIKGNRTRNHITMNTNKSLRGEKNFYRYPQIKD